MRFRKKPVEIEAVKVADVLHDAQHDWKALPWWIRDAYDGKNNAGVRGIVFSPTSVSINTLEGLMEGGVDDWIIRGVKGELYPCKPDIFAATYEAVE